MVISYYLPMKEILALLASDQASTVMALVVCALYWVLLWRVTGRYNPVQK